MQDKASLVCGIIKFMYVFDIPVSCGKYEIYCYRPVYNTYRPDKCFINL